MPFVHPKYVNGGHTSPYRYAVRTPTPIKLEYTYVVTGGAGFIGSNVVAALNARGITDILIVDRLGKGEKWRNLVGLRYEAFLDKDEFLDVLRTTDFRVKNVVHLGACSATTETDADYLMRNNTAYTRALCEWKCGNGTRLIVASSAATYGDGKLGYDDADGVTPTLRPLNMYGYSKQAFDEWALRGGWYKSIAGLKFFNVFGPREAHKGNMRSVVHKAYHEVKATGSISLFKSGRPDYADGHQKRDFVFVRDAVNVILWLLDNPTVCGLFNCGTGQARTWLDLAHAVFKAMNRKPQVVWKDMPPELAGKYQYYTEARMEKLRKAGYTAAFTPLEDAVRDYVVWLDANEA